MPGTVVLNPAAVDGYGNPISVTRDDAIDSNRILGSTIITGKPGVKIFDSEGNELETVTDGNVYVLAVRDEEQTGLLRMIHRQLKKMNFYLSQMVDQDIDDNDVED